MREGLVKYVGHRRGKFGQKVVGPYPLRHWCTRQPYHERWLSEVEARRWEKIGPWRVMRWREVDGQGAIPATVVAAAPAPPAVHVATALEQAELAVKQAEAQREVVDAKFVMSDRGVVHATGCANGPNRAYKTFNSLERSMADEDFSKAHQPCCKKHLRALNEASLKAIHERVDGAVAQMNAQGESYGLGQTEA